MRKRYKGLEMVDAYLVPKKEANAYKQQRKIARNAAKKAFKKKFPIVVSDWAGSEDGEGILAMDKSGKLVASVHLDPSGVEMILEGMKNNNLLEILLEINND